MQPIKLLFIFALLSNVVLAITPIPVRVESGLCESTAFSQKGSGVLFNEGNAAYVLTSEHVVLHSNGEYCHRFYLENGSPIEARLVIAEYGNGLALLKSALFISAPSLEEYSPRAITNTLSVEVLGFPHSTALLTRGNQGKVFIAKSSRQPFPLLASVVELSDAHGEFGMSGGPVVGESGELVGILSHQYLKIVPGGKTITQVFSKETQVMENGLVAIPGDEAIAWAREILKSSSPKAVYSRDPEEQLIRKEAVYVGGLRFEIQLVNPVAAPVGGGEGAGIGGGEGAGIGGGEGAGIGGEENRKSSLVEISLDLKRGSILWPISRLSQWQERTLSELRTRMKKVRVLFLVDKTAKGLVRLPVTSLGQFFTVLGNSTVSPVTQVESEETALSKTSREINALGVSIGELEKELYNQTLSSSSKLLLSEISLIATLSASQDWLLLDIESINAMTDVSKNNLGWKELFTTQFQKAVSLLEKLNALKEKLKQTSY